MSDEPFQVRRVAGALGAEVLGIDLACEVPTATVAALLRAWLDHQVLFFRDQRLTCAQYLRFAALFGAPVEYPFVKGLDGFPMITPVIKLEQERHNFGGIWHSDTTYLEQPPMASMLLAQEVPPCGGDTLFASQYLAWEALSPGLQSTLASLVGVSSSGKADVSRTREDRIRDGGRAHAPQAYLDGARSMSMSRTLPASVAGPRRRARRCSPICSVTRFGPSSLAGSYGNPGRSRCGTTAVCSTIRSTTTMGSGG
jgi:alpha-ketoglutarate-dependent taurine dioxygenase